MNKEQMEKIVLKSKKWEKVKGWKIDHELLSDGDETFVSSLGDIAEKCIFYVDILPDGSYGEICYKNIEELYNDQFEEEK